MNISSKVNKLMADKYITKKILVFSNGNAIDPGKVVRLTVNRKVPWHRILNEITEKIQPHFGTVKKLYTANGDSITSFSKLIDNEKYIASDNSQFQPVKGGYETTKERSQRKFLVHYNAGQLQYINNLRKLKVRPHLVVIFIFMNGKNSKSPQKFVLTKEELRNWDACLSHIATVLDMPYRSIKCLYDTDGNKICGPWEIQHGALYVAVGYNEKFIKREYISWLNTFGQMKKENPIISRDKNIRCCHERSLDTWKNNLKWKTLYVNEMYGNSYSNKLRLDLNFLDISTKNDEYTCRCLYYNMKDSKVTLTSDNKEERERIEQFKKNKEIIRTTRCFYSDSAVKPVNTICHKVYKTNL